MVMVWRERSCCEKVITAARTSRLVMVVVMRHSLMMGAVRACRFKCNQIIAASVLVHEIVRVVGLKWGHRGCGGSVVAR